MLKHTYRRVVLRCGERTKVRLVVEFEEEGCSLLAAFLNGEVPNFHREILETLGPVAQGRKETGEFRGNRCRLIVFRRMAVLMDGLEEAGLPLCKLPTEELIALIEEWLEEKER